MRKARWLTAALALLCGSAQAGDDLAWLEGCWATESEQTREVWQRASGGLLFGHNTLTRDGEVRFFEQLRLEERDGTWHFFAYPRGKGPTELVEAASGPLMLDVRAPEHDFPQRIVYRREVDNLTAVVSLLDGSEPRSWRYRPCPD
ncbi:MAG: DUF6265 family protein [Pseudomonadota bacterium]